MKYAPKNILLILLFIFATTVNGQSFKGFYKGYTKYLSNIPDSISANFYFKAKTTKKIVALTFDDGPLSNTPKIVSFLKQENIPATFFLVGKNITANNLKRYDSELFVVGIHTYKHDDYRKFNYQEKLDDVNRCLAIFKKYNHKVNYFRPAYGIIDKELSTILQQHQLKGIIWSIDSQDWNKFRGEKLVNHIEKNLENGSIILFHDWTSVQDLKSIVKMIQRKGYQMVHIDEMMNYKNDL